MTPDVEICERELRLQDLHARMRDFLQKKIDEMSPHSRGSRELMKADADVDQGRPQGLELFADEGVAEEDMPEREPAAKEFEWVESAWVAKMDRVIEIIDPAPRILEKLLVDGDIE